MNHPTIFNKIVTIATGYIFFPGFEIDMDSIKEYLLKHESTGYLINFLKGMGKLK
ncbi:MAG: hypothetical protein ABIN67_17470 [Ferruginibacter sp.]